MALFASRRHTPRETSIRSSSLIPMSRISLNAKIGSEYVQSSKLERNLERVLTETRDNAGKPSGWVLLHHNRDQEAAGEFNI